MSGFIYRLLLTTVREILKRTTWIWVSVLQRFKAVSILNIWSLLKINFHSIKNKTNKITGVSYKASHPPQPFSMLTFKWVDISDRTFQLPLSFIYYENKYLSLVFILLCSHHPLVSIQLYFMWILSLSFEHLMEVFTPGITLKWGLGLTRCFMWIIFAPYPSNSFC